MREFFGARMRLLLINPRYPESFWSFKWAVDGILPQKRAIKPSRVTHMESFKVFRVMTYVRDEPSVAIPLGS